MDNSAPRRLLMKLGQSSVCCSRPRFSRPSQSHRKWRRAL